MHKRIIPVLLMVCLLASWLPAFAEETAPTYKTDLYEAVNAEWSATAVIADDQYAVGGFSDLQIDLDKNMVNEFKQMLADGVTPTDPRLAQAVTLYGLALNFDQRNADGLAPLKPYLEKIEGITSLADLQSKLVDLALDGITTPLTFGPSEDMLDPNLVTLYFQGAPLFLPDVSYYEEGNETGAMLLSMLSSVSSQLLVMAGYDETRAAEILSNALAFDKLQAPLTFSAEESADLTNLINPYTQEELAQAISTIDINAVLTEAFGDVSGLDHVIVLSPRYYEAFADVVSEDNIPIIRDWMILRAVNKLAAYCSEEAIVLLQSVTNALTGQQETKPLDEITYNEVHAIFSEAIGLYYAQTYFGEEAKADVTAMVENSINVYRERLKANTWLSAATLEKALLKLDTMRLQVGYPEKIDPFYDELKVQPADQGGTYVANMTQLTRVIMEKSFDSLTEPVDKTLWITSADVVNAFYNPQRNSIVFPAAILQAPFYSLDQTASQNYGGIGAIIAHEISHAFDPNGSRFDETGAMVDWWQPEDYAKFEEHSQRMIAVFDGMEYAGITLSGAQLVGENVADASGLGTALQVVKSLPDADLSEFFISWATIWRTKYRPELEQYIAVIDTHAPAKLRTNVIAGMFEEFHEAFGVVEGDPMYRAPEDRVVIW